MKTSIKKSFTYMFQDTDWKFKLFLLLLLNIPSFIATYCSENFKNLRVDNEPIFVGLIFAFSILMFIANFIIEGFYNTTTHNVMKIPADAAAIPLMPKWEGSFWHNFKVGFKFFIATGLFALVIAAVLFISFILYLVKIPLLSLIFAGVALALCIFYALTYTALKSVFSTDYRIKSFFCFKKAFKLIKNNIKLYLVVIVLTLALSMALVGTTALFITSPLIIVVGAALQAYIALVFASFRGSLFPAPASEFFGE